MKFDINLWKLSSQYGEVSVMQYCLNYLRYVKSLILCLNVLRKMILNPIYYMFMCDCVYLDGYH